MPSELVIETSECNTSCLASSEVISENMRQEILKSYMTFMLYKIL